MSLGDTQNFQRYPPPRPSELPGIFGEVYKYDLDQYGSLFLDFTYPPASQQGRGGETMPPNQAIPRT
jgi:protein kinase A